MRGRKPRGFFRTASAKLQDLGARGKCAESIIWNMQLLRMLAAGSTGFRGNLRIKPIQERKPFYHYFHFPYVKHAKYILAAILATLSALNLLLKDTLESDSIGCEFRDTFSKLLDSHCLLIEVESEERLIVEVALLWDVEALCVAGD